LIVTPPLTAPAGPVCGIERAGDLLLALERSALPCLIAGVDRT
jgi:hypothetical protein